MSEKKRIVNKSCDIATALRNAGEKGMTNGELSKISLRYGGSIGYLRMQGFTISTEKIGNGLYNYVLISEPVEHIEKPKAHNVLIDRVKELSFVSAEGLEKLFEDIGVSVRYNAGTHQQ